MNWYKIILSQTMTSYLETLQVEPNVIQYIMSQPQEHAQLLTNEIRKNPNLTTKQLQQVQQPQQINPYLNHEIKHTSFYDKIFGKWMLVNFRKIRKGVNDLKKLSPIDLGIYDTFFDKTEEIHDWYRNVNPDISSYSAQEATLSSDEWHRMMAGKGKGKRYEPTKPESIIYGPEWQNLAWQGWTIQKVVSENDLLAEGNKMDHCVGSFCKGVEDKSIIIYSLRDPQNNPKVTIETDGSGKEVEQIQGNSNSYPDGVYTDMIKEWVNYGKGSPERLRKDRYFINWEIGGSLDSIAYQLQDLRNGYIEENDGDYNDISPSDYGLEENESPEFVEWSNNFDLNKLMNIIFEAITYEYNTVNVENINWYDSEVDKSLLETVKEYDMEQNTKFYTKTLIGILKEEIRDDSNVYEENTPIIKSFAKHLLKLIAVPEGQMSFNFASGNNWYKKANSPVLEFLSYNSYGQFRVSINEVSYTYYDVSPFEANKLRWMIEKSKIPSGVIIQRLKKFSNPKKHKELNPPEEHTKEEKNEMLDELHNRGLLN